MIMQHAYYAWHGLDVGGALEQNSSYQTSGNQPVNQPPVAPSRRII